MALFKRKSKLGQVVSLGKAPLFVTVRKSILQKIYAFKASMSPWNVVIWDVVFIFEGYLQLRVTDICLNKHKKSCFAYSLKYIINLLNFL